MSDNKYIIDKDSLTGIADAVRNKLGNGKAITDEDAGYYPVHVKKLGYHKTAGTASFSGPGSGYTGNTIYARPISELENICGIRPSYIKVTVTNSSGFNSNDIIFRYTNINSPESSRVDSARFSNYVAILSIPSDIDDCYIEYGGYYSTYSSQYSKRDLPAYDVVFLDSNQNEIYINGYSEDSFTVDQWGTRETFLVTETSFEKIPFTIDDIQDRITNYWKTSKIVLLSNFYVRGKTYTDVTDLKPYGGLSNIELIVGRYDSNSLGYLDMVNHPNRIGTYNDSYNTYDTYRFYRSNAGTETYLMDVQHDTLYGKDQLYQMTGSYGLTLSPCFIIYKEG